MRKDLNRHERHRHIHWDSESAKAQIPGGVPMNVHMIQKIRKNGMKRVVIRVTIASSARPTLSIPTKLTIQKMRKPEWPNL